MDAAAMHRGEGSESEPAGAAASRKGPAAGMGAAIFGEAVAAAAGVTSVAADSTTLGRIAGSSGAAEEPSLRSQIEALRQEQHNLVSVKKRLLSELRDAQRKKKRLVHRARQLTDKDLMSVLMMRKEARGTPGSQDGEADKDEEEPVEAPPAQDGRVSDKLSVSSGETGPST